MTVTIDYDDSAIRRAVSDLRVTIASQRARERFEAAYRAARMVQSTWEDLTPNERDGLAAIAARAAGWTDRQPIDDRRGWAWWLANHNKGWRSEWWLRPDDWPQVLRAWRTQRTMAPYARRLP